MPIETITLPGSGEDVAVDTATEGGIQLIKLAISTDGSAVLIPADGTSGLYVQVAKALPTGTNSIGKLGANSGVIIGDVNVTGFQAEDDVHTTGDAGVMSLGVRRDTETVSSGTDGDYEPLQTDATGNLRVNAAVRAADGTILSLAPAKAVGATLSIDASEYVTNDNLDGDIISFADAVATSGGVSHIVGVSVQDKGDTGPDLSIFFLSGSITPQSQNAAFTMTDTDAQKLVAVVHTADGVWEDYVQGQKCFIPCAPPKPIYCDATTLYAVVRVNDASYTPASTSDITITPTFLR